MNEARQKAVLELAAKLKILKSEVEALREEERRIVGASRKLPTISQSQQSKDTAATKISNPKVRY